MVGDEWVLVSDETFRNQHWYFLLFPPIFRQRRGEAQSRGKSKIRDELGSQPSQGLKIKQKSSESAESLASRNLRTLDGVPWSGKWKGGTKKSTHPPFESTFN
jgi:hypothetical protein